MDEKFLDELLEEFSRTCWKDVEYNGCLKTENLENMKKSLKHYFQGNNEK